jgi:putative Ca2+/H+ antiporter (TMEM165/GDT1 family)
MAPLIASDPVGEIDPKSAIVPHDLASVETVQDLPVPTKNSPTSFFQVTLTTFLTVFLAEIGDKTQLTTLMITAESKQPVVVFAGAGIALVLTSLLGAMAGKWLGEKVPPRILNLLAAFSFLGLSISLVWDAVS